MREEDGSMSPSTAAAVAMVMDHGGTVLMGEAECVLRKSRHPESPCRGCVSEIGCGKVIAIRMTLLRTAGYLPRNIEDAMHTQDVLGDAIVRIVEAKTREEVEELMVHPFGRS